MLPMGGEGGKGAVRHGQTRCISRADNAMLSGFCLASRQSGVHMGEGGTRGNGEGVTEGRSLNQSNPVSQ